jgi:peptidoglycan hydrolase-like protein with peptidoglycan-binding domain
MNLRRVRWLIVALFALSPFAVLTARGQSAPPEIAPLLERERWLNDKCRGGSGDDPLTADYCALRDKADAQLQAKGWCWGHAGQYGYQKGWELCAASSATQQRVGPSFDCSSAPVAQQPLAQIICSNDGLARTDLSYVNVYSALRETLSDTGRKALREEANAFVERVRAACAIPSSGALEGRPSNVLVGCITDQYNAQRALLVRRLSGGALEESYLAPEEAVDIQKRLKAVGFLPDSAVIDGVLGPATREAIIKWQISSDVKVTGFASREMHVALGRGSGRIVQAPAGEANSGRSPSDGPRTTSIPTTVDPPAAVTPLTPGANQAERQINEALKDPEKIKLMECIGVKVYNDPQPPGHPPSAAECERVLAAAGASAPPRAAAPASPPTSAQQQIDDARALTLEQWQSHTQLVTTIEIGFKCGVVEQSLANLAVQRIAIMMDEQKANNGLINDRALDIGAAISWALEDGRRIADLNSDPQICSKFFASPADRARLRQTVDILIQ